MIGRVLPLMALGGAAYSQQEEAEALVNTVLDTVRVGVLSMRSPTSVTASTWIRSAAA